MYGWTVSSSEMLPCSAKRITEVAENILVAEPNGKIVPVSMRLPWGLV